MVSGGSGCGLSRSGSGASVDDIASALHEFTVSANIFF